jgi:hypothetical protein
MVAFDQFAAVQLDPVDDIVEIPSPTRRLRIGPVKDRDLRVRERAYLLWEGAGRPNGQQEQHWLMAALEIDAEINAAEANHASR